MRPTVMLVLVAGASCVLDSAQSDSFRRDDFEVEENGTVRLADDVVRVEECGDGETLTRVDGVWGCAATPELDALIDAALAEVERCPPGYARDPEAADGIVVCVRGSDEMVRVGSFWVDRYEASVWSGASCTGTQYGAISAGDGDEDYPSTFPDSGNWTVPLYACSVAGVTPSRMLTWFQAAQACVLSGKHLITNAEWQTAVAGTADPLVPHDGSSGGACHTQGLGPRASGHAGLGPGAPSSCISRWGAEDMIGNLFEWTALWEMEPGFNGQGSIWPDAGRDYGDDAYYHGGDDPDVPIRTDGSHHVFHRGEGARLPGTIMRGGPFQLGVSSGAFAISAQHGPGDARHQLGFRCARE